MTASISIPVEKALAVPEGTEKPRPRFVYVEGKRTDTPVLDGKGRPLYSFTAVVESEITGRAGGVRISTPYAELPEIALTQALVLSNAVLIVRNQRGAFDLGLSLEAQELEILD